MSSVVSTTRLPRWGTRLEAMAHARIGSTLMNEWIQQRRVMAKRCGRKILIDLNSVDDLIHGLPSPGEEFAA